MTLVFFVRKKDSKKKMVQNSRYSNQWTIKNNSLSLISDIVENIGTKKVSTKLDSQQDYNNIWIKKGDEWKMVFMTLEELFKPMVIFFELTNSLATFQTMMSKILQDLINTRKQLEQQKR